MRSSNADWRDTYYATALVGVQATVTEEDNRLRPQSRPDRYSPGEMVPAVIAPMHPNSSLHVTSSPAVNEPITSEPLSTVASTSSTGTPPTEIDKSDSTSPSTSFTGSLSSSTLGSSVSSFDLVRCYSCNKEFEGSSGSTNLRRHLRSTKAHNGVAKFQCPKADCNKGFSRRDNLHAHVRMVHEAVQRAALERSQVVDRLKDVLK